MMEHSRFSDALVDIGNGLLVAQALTPLIKLRRVEMSLPLEVWMRPSKGAPVFYAGLPIWRWRTVFDQTPSRVCVAWETVDG